MNESTTTDFNTIIWNSKPTKDWKYYPILSSIINLVRGFGTTRVSCLGTKRTNRVLIKNTLSKKKVTMTFNEKGILIEVQEKSRIEVNNMQNMYVVKSNRLFTKSTTYFKEVVDFVVEELRSDSPYVQQCKELGVESLRYKTTQRWREFINQPEDGEILFKTKVAAFEAKMGRIIFKTKNDFDSIDICPSDTWWQTTDWIGKYLIFSRSGKAVIFRDSSVDSYF